jgi:hypothetical protein
VGIETRQVTGEEVVGLEGGGVFCLATTRAGRRCRGIPIRGDGYCFAHSAALSEKRLAAQQAGGRAVSERRRLLVGAIDVSTSTTRLHCLATLARAMLRKEIPSGLGVDVATVIGRAREEQAAIAIEELQAGMGELRTMLTELKREVADDDGTDEAA